MHYYFQKRISFINIMNYPCYFIIIHEYSNYLYHTKFLGQQAQKGMKHVQFHVDCSKIQMTAQPDTLTIHLNPNATFHPHLTKQQLPIHFINPQALIHLQAIFQAFLAQQQQSQPLQPSKAVDVSFSNDQPAKDASINHPENIQNSQQDVQNNNKSANDPQNRKNSANKNSQNLINSNVNALNRNVFATSPTIPHNPFLTSLKTTTNQQISSNQFNNQKPYVPAFGNRSNSPATNSYPQNKSNFFINKNTATNSNQQFNQSHNNFQQQSNRPNNIINPFTTTNNSSGNQSNLLLNRMISNNYGNNSNRGVGDDPYGNKDANRGAINNNGNFANQSQGNIFMPAYTSTNPSLFQSNSRQSSSQNSSYHTRNRFGSGPNNNKNRPRIQ